LRYERATLALATFAIPFVASFASAFDFAQLSLLQLGTIVAIVLGYVAATELAKAWFFRAPRH